ncbi:MAG: MFS transporter, partial [Chloroflexota bacterium]
GWPSIFYVNIPVGILAIILSLYALPNDRQRTTQRFDIPGAGFLAVSLLLILLALTEGQYWGWTDWRILAFFAFGIAGLFLFVWWERRTKAPMINLSIFSNWTFSASLLSSLGAFLALSFNLFLIPFYLQNVLGFDPQQAGFVLIATPLALSLTSPISGRLSDRFGTRWLAILGLIISALGLFSMTTLTTESTAVGVFGRLLLIGAGVGFFQSPNNSAIMGNAPRSAFGIAGSLISIMRTIGQTGGIALAGAVWAARVTASAGETYDPINAAPPNALVAGLHDAMLLAAGLCLVAIVPTLLRSQRADQDIIAESSTP